MAVCRLARGRRTPRRRQPAAAEVPRFGKAVPSQMRPSMLRGSRCPSWKSGPAPPGWSKSRRGSQVTNRHMPNYFVFLPGWISDNELAFRTSYGLAATRSEQQRFAVSVEAGGFTHPNAAQAFACRSVGSIASSPSKLLKSLNQSKTSVCLLMIGALSRVQNGEC